MVRFITHLDITLLKKEQRSLEMGLNHKFHRAPLGKNGAKRLINFQVSYRVPSKYTKH